MLSRTLVSVNHRGEQRPWFARRIEKQLPDATRDRHAFAPHRRHEDGKANEIRTHARNVGHGVRARGMTGPHRVANAKSVSPPDEHLRVFFSAARSRSETRSETGEVWRDDVQIPIEERVRERPEVRAGHAEAVHEDDVAPGAGFAERDATERGQRP